LRVLALLIAVPPKISGFGRTYAVIKVDEVSDRCRFVCTKSALFRTDHRRGHRNDERKCGSNLRGWSEHKDYAAFHVSAADGERHRTSGTQGWHDGNRGRTRIDGAGVVVWWRLQHVRALGRAAPGTAQNLAELVLDGSHSKASGSTSASTFALLITAEPHFLVNTPSSFVVLENEPQSPELTLQYRVLEGLYNFERSTLEDTKEAKGHVHTEVRQAFTAVRLAQRAGASRLAPREFIEAQQALTELTNLWHQQREWSEVRLQARKTVRLAVAAQQLAINRALR
jgi:hypothetical protein